MGRLGSSQNPLEGVDVLILDAMGVIYKASDDVEDLLIPFIREKGGGVSNETIKEAYIGCSLGLTDTSTFWAQVGMKEPRGLDEEYILRHELSGGVVEFVKEVPGHVRLVCLSNDVSRWSKLLRRRFGLDSYFEAWFISGEMGLRKPGNKIYDRMLAELHCRPERCLFIDDNVKNLNYPRELGMKTIQFHPGAPLGLDELGGAIDLHG